LILTFGVDYRYVEAAYIGRRCASARRPAAAHACPCVVSLVMAGRPPGLPHPDVHGTRHHGGGAGPGRAAAHGGDPIRHQAHRVRASRSRPPSLAGAFLIIIQPIEPSVGANYRRVFGHLQCWAGSAALPGTLIAAMLLGVVESMRRQDRATPVLGAGAVSSASLLTGRSPSCFQRREQHRGDQGAGQAAEPPARRWEHAPRYIRARPDGCSAG